MKLTLLFACICFCLLSISCTNNQQNCNDNSLTKQEKSKQQISAETAIAIAKGNLCFDYNLKNYEISVSEKSDSWEVKFIGREIVNEGTGPVAYINKVNGEQIYVIHSK